MVRKYLIVLLGCIMLTACSNAKNIEIDDSYVTLMAIDKFSLSDSLGDSGGSEGESGGSEGESGGSGESVGVSTSYTVKANKYNKVYLCEGNKAIGEAKFSEFEDLTSSILEIPSETNPSTQLSNWDEVDFIILENQSTNNYADMLEYLTDTGYAVERQIRTSSFIDTTLRGEGLYRLYYVNNSILLGKLGEAELLNITDVYSIKLFEGETTNG